MHRYFALLALALFVGMAAYLRGLRPNIARAQLTFSEDAFLRVIGQWSTEGRRRFEAHFIADYVFILLYTTAGWLYGQAQAGSTAGVLAVGLATWSLPAAGLADLAENLCHQQFLRAKPGTLPQSRFALAGIAATCKYVLMVIFASTWLVLSGASAA